MQQTDFGGPGRSFAGRVALAAASWLAVTAGSAGGAQAATYLSNVPDTALGVLASGLRLASGAPSAPAGYDTTGPGAMIDGLLIEALSAGGNIYANATALLAFDATGAFLQRGSLFSATPIPKPSSRWTP